MVIVEVNKRQEEAIEGEKMIFFFPLLVLGLFLPMVSDFASSLGHSI